MERPKCACFSVGNPDVGDKMLDMLGSHILDTFSQYVNLGGDQEDDGWYVCAEAEEYALSVCVVGLVSVITTAQMSREGLSPQHREVFLGRLEKVMERLPGLLKNRMEVIRHQLGMQHGARH